MQDSNSIQKTERACTTPQRKRFVESIKKSIHRSIEKIDPSQYKNILKGEYVFMHLCHKGEIINSEYTKVALFMGAIVFKKAVQKVTVVVTNESSNKAVKKLALMGKPILSVLWLESCFQEKRKVPHEDFFFQQQVTEKKSSEQNQNQNSVNFGSLVSNHQQQLKSAYQKFAEKNNHKFLRFIDKKQKINKSKVHLIPVHEIDLSIFQPSKPQKRRSFGLSQNLPKKRINKKMQFKSEGADKILKKQTKDQSVLTKVKEQEKTKEETPRLKKSIYEKYLKEFKNFEQNIKKQGLQQIKKNLQTYAKNDEENNNYNGIVTNAKDQSLYAEVSKTNSKAKTDQIRIILANPLLSEKIVNINKMRSQIGAPLIEAIGVDMRNQVWVIENESKTQALLAWLSKPKMVISVNFFNALELNPSLQINDELFSKFEVKFGMNTGLVQGKTIALFDSVLGLQFLERVIKECNGKVLLPKKYLFSKQIADIIISNKKTAYQQKADQKTMSEANFINELLQFQSCK